MNSGNKRALEFISPPRYVTSDIASELCFKSSVIHIRGTVIASILFRNQ